MGCDRLLCDAVVVSVKTLLTLCKALFRLLYVKALLRHCDCLLCDAILVPDPPTCLMPYALCLVVGDRLMCDAVVVPDPPVAPTASGFVLLY